MHIIEKYFPDLTKEQRAQFAQLVELYTHWNAQINVISRKDMEHFYERHVLHSLAIAKLIAFKPNTHILDVGTGGGFPGIPLAILFPDSNFLLVDSIGKKIKVVNEVVNSLGLTNVKSNHIRAEEINQKFDFVVSRAVTRLVDFYPWVKQKFNKSHNNQLKNGILYLKGGDLKAEIHELNLPCKSHPIQSFFTEPFFETKFVLHIAVN